MLVDAHVPVRALAHRRSTADELEALGMDVVSADLDHPAAIAPALRDVEQVFLVTPMHPALAEREMSLIDHAERAGVDRVVKVSGALKLGGHPLTSAHSDVVAALKGSGMAWTVLAPSLTMETALLPHLDAARRDGLLWGAAGDGRVALVAVDDVARAATLVLAERSYDGAEIELTGPEALSFPEIAERVSNVLGVPVAYRDVAEGALADHLLEAGLPAERIEFEFLLQFAAIRNGGAARVTGELERLTGSPPAALDALLGPSTPAWAPRGGAGSPATWSVTKFPGRARESALPAPPPVPRGSAHGSPMDRLPVPRARAGGSPRRQRGATGLQRLHDVQPDHPLGPRQARLGRQPEGQYRLGAARGQRSRTGDHRCRQGAARGRAGPARPLRLRRQRRGRQRQRHRHPRCAGVALPRAGGRGPDDGRRAVEH